MPFGEYIWEETGVPEGYVKLDESNPYNNSPLAPSAAERTITIESIPSSSSPSVKGELKNRPVLGNYSFTKVNQMDGALTYPEGTPPDYKPTFQLFSDAEHTKSIKNEEHSEGKDVSTDTFVADQDGNVTMKYLRPGTYYFKEIGGPEYYEHTAVGSFTIGSDSNNDDKKTVKGGNVKNWQTGKFTIHKVDSRSNPESESDKDLIKDGKTSIRIVAVDKEGANTPSNGERKFEKEYSMPDGTLTVELKVGWYYYEEVNPPAGYEKDDSKHYFEVQYQDSGTYDYKTGRLANRPVEKLIVEKTISNIKEAPSGTPNTTVGAKFNLYSKKSGADVDESSKINTGEVIVGENGIAAFERIYLDGLTDDTVYLKEINVPAGYQLSKEIMEIKLNPSPAVSKTVNFENVMSLATVKVMKEDEEGNPVTGATLSLYKIEGESLTLVKTAVSKQDTKDGKEVAAATFENIPTGEYVVKEEADGVPTHYKKADPEEMISLTILDENHGDVIWGGKDDKGKPKDAITNIRIGQYTVHKTDGSNGKPIEGVEFTLSKEGSTHTRTKTTGSDGTAVFTGLEFGSYTCVETITPDGYFGYSDSYKPRHTFRIDENNFKNKGGVTWECENWPIKAKLQVLKLDSESELPLEGAVFRLDEMTENVWKPMTDASGRNITVTTDGEGYAVTDMLNPGSYRLTETKAPAGYATPSNAAQVEFKISDRDMTLTMDYDDTDEAVQPYITIDQGIDNKKAIVFNEPRGSFILTKVDSTDKTILLDGARITVTQDGKKIRELVTGMEGQVHGQAEFTDLPYGTYHWEETTPPDGYIRAARFSGDVTISAPGRNTDQYITLENRPVPRYAVVITKTGEPDERPLEGARIGIYKYEEGEKEEGTLIDTVVTDSSGRAELGGLFCTMIGDHKDNYYFQELEAPKGYDLDSGKYSFHLEDDGKDDKDKKLVLSLKDKLTRGSIQFTKVDYSEAANPLAGAVFELTYEGPGESGVDNPMLESERVRRVTTAADGRVVFDNLPLGEYVCTEIKAPEGYHLDKGWKVRIVLTEENPDQGIVPDTEASSGKNTLVNYGLYWGSLKITKTDQDGKPLSGAKYGVFSRSNDQPVAGVPEGITGADGTVTFGPLYEGDYYCREIAAPPHYALDDSLYEFTITENESLIEKTFMNQELIKGSFRLTKTGESGEPLEGALIGVFVLDSQYEKPDTLIASAITDRSGIVQFDGLERDDQQHYYYRELSAPVGYILDETKYPFAFTIGEQGETVTASLTNYLKKGSFELTKVKKGTEEPLQGADISVFKPDGTLVEKKTTGADGKALFTGLMTGNYYYEETQAPSGYRKDNSRHPFTITEHGQLITEILENTRRTSGGSGTAGPARPTGKPADPNAPGPGNQPAPAETQETPKLFSLPNNPVDPTNPETLPPVDPQNPPQELPVEMNSDGSKTVAVPVLPPETNIIVTNSRNEIVFGGATNEYGTFRMNLPSDTYTVLAIDANHVPLAQFMFTINDGYVPKGTLPKTGEGNSVPVLWGYILLGAVMGTYCLAAGKKRRQKRN